MWNWRPPPVQAPPPQQPARTVRQFLRANPLGGPTGLWRTRGLASGAMLFEQRLLTPFLGLSGTIDNMSQALTVQQDSVDRDKALRAERYGKTKTVKPRTVKTRRKVTARDREAIIEASAVEGLTQPQIAERFDRSPHTIRGILRSPAGQRRKEEILKEIAEEAKTRLRRAAGHAANSWVQIVKDSPTAERIKDYKAARDLLTHAGVVDVPKPKQDKGTEIVLQIGTGSLDEAVPIESTADAVEPSALQAVPGRAIAGTVEPKTVELETVEKTVEPEDD